jgi:hypothetical protein
LRGLFTFGAAASILGWSAPAEAASCVERPNALIADLGLHVVNVGYQRTLNCYASLQTSAGLYGPWTVNNDVAGLGGGDRVPPGDVLGFVVRVRSFVYPLGKAPGGLWLSPYAQAGAVRGTRGFEALPGLAIAAGASAGWAFLLGRRVILSLGLGVQYHQAWFGGTTAYPGFARLGPTLDINAGYRF